MQFSKEWILSEYADNATINEEKLVSVMTALGHTVEKYADYWDIQSPARRPDCRSVAGIAREICVAMRIPFHYETPTVLGCENASIFEMLDVDVWDDELCNRLTCRVAYNIRNSASPHWLQQRLLHCGITPVDCITDAAQYVKLELGQPLLILDQRCCNGSLTLRQSFPGESEEESMVLAGDFQPIVIGNTICDEEALLREDTDGIIICAIHNCENTNDSLLTHTAVERMCQLIETLHCGIVADGTIDILNFIPHERRISCTVDEINERCNTNFTDTALTALLRPTGISMEGHEFVIPAHRSDLISVADLMGEIIRLHNIQKLNICS